jgi:endonuclease-3
MINQKKAIRQLKAIEKLAENRRLAADGWDEDWKILIATLMSARTTDKITIPIAERLFKRYKSIKRLSNARLNDVASLIKGVNFYKTKARNVSSLAKILVKEYDGKVPHDFEKLIELPGVGRKTANVFLAEKGFERIGIDTHCQWIAQQMGWTKLDKQHEIETDLERLFPKEYWGKINWILVRFGQTYPSRRKKREILERIKRIR